MNIPIWNLFETAIAIFEIVVYTDLYSHFFTRKRSNLFFWLFVSATCLENSAVSVFLNDPLILLINCISVNLLLAFVLFEGSVPGKLFSVVLTVAIALLAEVLTGLLISVLGSEQGSETYNITGIALSKVVFFTIIKSIERFRKAKSGVMSTKIWLMLLLIPIISILIIHQIAYSMSPVRAELPMIAIAGILYINILVFALFETLMRQAQREVDYKLMSQQVEYQTNYYKSLSESRNEIRRIWHDLKNHMLCLSSMASEGDLTGIKNYIECMNILTADAAKTVDTGNQAIDAVLNEKRAAAEREEISVSFDLMIPPNIKIDPIDACILLGNSLDNAIEACKKMKDRKRAIEVKFIRNDDHLLFNIVNTADEHYQQENSKYLSTKQDPKGHGFGLLNIASIVEKYGGNLILSHDSEHFVLCAILRERA